MWNDEASYLLFFWLLTLKQIGSILHLEIASKK